MRSTPKTEVLKRVGTWQRVQDCVDLMKPGITLLVMITALAGFYLGSAGLLDLSLLIWTLLGTGLVAGGGGALNHLLERDADARMARTRNRPLPGGRMQPMEVLLFGSVTSLGGVAVLFLFVNEITTLLAIISWISYVFLYTPLKRVTPYATLIGAVPGALPPMGGWTAVQGEITFGALILFAILFLWQLPHFLAIAWLCRNDYAKGGFPMLTVLQEARFLTGPQMVIYSAGLLVVSLIPSAIGMTGAVYFIGAFVAGIGFLGINILTARSTNTRNARRALYASIVYLPVLLLLMMADKVTF